MNDDDNGQCWHADSDVVKVPSSVCRISNGMRLSEGDRSGHNHATYCNHNHNGDRQNIRDSPHLAGRSANKLPPVDEKTKRSHAHGVIGKETAHEGATSIFERQEIGHLSQSASLSLPQIETVNPLTFQQQSS